MGCQVYGMTVAIACDTYTALVDRALVSGDGVEVVGH